MVEYVKNIAYIVCMVEYVHTIFGVVVFGFTKSETVDPVSMLDITFDRHNPVLV